MSAYRVGASFRRYVMNNNAIGTVFLSVAASIAIFTALAHFSCIFIGEDCYRFQMAPEAIIQSAEMGTLLAPIGTIIVSLLFIICGSYALSAANVIVKLPLLNTAIYALSLLCILRGLATIPLLITFPKEAGTFAIAAGATWFITGLLFFVGFQLRQNAVQETSL